MFCGFNRKMVRGMALFAQGLFEAALDRAAKERLSLREAFDAEVDELGIFMEALDKEYRAMRRTRGTKAAIRGTVGWAARSGAPRSATSASR